MQNNEFVFKNILDIPFIPTSHNSGEKRVILSMDESHSSITQIAEASLKKGVFIESHVHPTMIEHFLFTDGECLVTIGSTELKCTKGSFVKIPAGISHSVCAIEDSRLMAIGVAI